LIQLDQHMKLKFDDTYIYLQEPTAKFNAMQTNFDDVHGDNVLEATFKDIEMDGLMNEPIEQAKA